MTEVEEGWERKDTRPKERSSKSQRTQWGPRLWGGISSDSVGGRLGWEAALLESPLLRIYPSGVGEAERVGGDRAFLYGCCHWVARSAFLNVCSGVPDTVGIQKWMGAREMPPMCYLAPTSVWGRVGVRVSAGTQKRFSFGTRGLGTVTALVVL